MGAALLQVDQPLAGRPDQTSRLRQTLSTKLFNGGLSTVLPRIGSLGGIRVHRKITRTWEETLGRIGSLELRLAAKAIDVRRAQRLRYQVFFKEMSAVPGVINLLTRRDIDVFDAVCDHLLVFDHGEARGRPWGRSRVVGAYRLLRQEVAERAGGFYTAGEYEIGDLLQRHRGLHFLELGRSCVLPAYRHRRTIELLWHGIWTYVLRHRVDVLIGCASFDGTDPDRLALPLSFLHHYAAAPEEWRVEALPRRYVEMKRLPKSQVDVKAALKELPPLIKGYLRLGAFVGRGAVIDRQFGTTDVLMVLPVAEINRRYIAYFGPAAERHAA
jgi:putative hemolysin